MKKLFSTLILLAILIGVGILVTRNTDNGKISGTKATSAEVKNVQSKYSNNIILFTGKGCPHCANIEEFLKTNKVSDKVKYETKEVWYNKDNNNQMLEIAKSCGIAEDQLGVPFLWTGKDCKVGEDEVMAFFKTQAGIK